MLFNNLLLKVNEESYLISKYILKVYYQISTSLFVKSFCCWETCILDHKAFHNISLVSIRPALHGGCLGEELSSWSLESARLHFQYNIKYLLVVWPCNISLLLLVLLPGAITQFLQLLSCLMLVLRWSL